MPISTERRSVMMSLVRSKNTKPELRVRKIARRMGYRFSLHRHTLPGKPDIVFGGQKKVIFVHGCFWHQHRGCSFATVPKINHQYWLPKLARTKKRDSLNKRELTKLGWKYLVIWECRTADEVYVEKALHRFLK